MGIGIGTAHQLRYLPVGSNSGAFTLTANGRFENLTASRDANHALAGSVNLILHDMVDRSGRLCRGAEIRFFAEAENNATFDYRVWGVKQGLSAPNVFADYERNYLGGGSCTVGTATGIAGGAILDTEKIVDTLTWTPSSSGTSPSGPMEQIEATYGGSILASAYSPADNTCAVLFLVDVGCHPLILVEFDNTTTNAANVRRMNCLIENVR